MISRIWQTLLLVMVAACAVMAVVLIHMRQQEYKRLKAPLPNSVPLSQTPDEPRVSVTLLTPDDKTGQLTPVSQTIALPQDKSARACMLLQQLIASWNAPGSLHPMHVRVGVDSVFLLPIPNQPGQELAVVNFDAAFPQAQPSGIEPESLTLLSIIQTLHSNLPSITQVRFLVNGQSRATLAGHADLMRTYLADTTLPGPKS